MEPALRPGDRVFALPLVGPVEPEAGDVVLYHVDGTRCGFPGEVVSCDSRVFGPVPRASLEGEVVAVYWPPRRISFP